MRVAVWGLRVVVVMSGDGGVAAPLAWLFPVFSYRALARVCPKHAMMLWHTRAHTQRASVCVVCGCGAEAFARAGGSISWVPERRLRAAGCLSNVPLSLGG